MFQVGDKVVRLQTEGIQVVPAGTIGEVTFASKSSTQIKFEDWKGATDGQRNQSYGNAELFIEKVEVNKPVKTWEMLRDIKVGEIWFNQNGMAVVLHVRAKGIVWEVSEAPVVFTSTMLETYEWKKQPKLVGFAEAWDAYENGKTIRPSTHTSAIKKKEDTYDIFTSNEIRGKWEVLD